MAISSVAGNDRGVAGRSSGDEGRSYPESDEKLPESNGAVAGPGVSGVWSKRKASGRGLVLGFGSSNTNPSPTVGDCVPFAVADAVDSSCECATLCSTASSIRSGLMTDLDAMNLSWLTCIACAGGVPKSSSPMGVTYAALAVSSELSDEFSSLVALLVGGEASAVTTANRGDREVNVIAGLEIEGLRYCCALDMGSSSEGILMVGVGRRDVPCLASSSCGASGTYTELVGSSHGARSSEGVILVKPKAEQLLGDRLISSSVPRWAGPLSSGARVGVGDERVLNMLVVVGTMCRDELDSSPSPLA